MHLSTNSHVVNPEKLYFECIFPLKLYLENSGKTDVKVRHRCREAKVMCNREEIKCRCASFKACVASLYMMTYELKTN